MIRLIDNNEKVIETFNLKFTKRNVDKIASNYDAQITKFDTDTKSAVLKDSKGRLLFIDEVSKRFMKKMDEAIPGGGIWHRFGFPDDGTGISTDDDRPPGNILIGVKYKPIDYFNRLTSFNRNWDMDTGEWLWNHFENAGGQDDFENYSETLKGLEKLLPKETWKEVWRRMRHVPDAEASADFDAAGQPHRGADTQLGKDKEEYIDDPPKEIQSEDLITRIDRLTL